jgi:hypothetical protein
MVAAPTVDTGFGVFVTAACKVSADDGDSLVDVAFDVAQADNSMDRMNVRVSSFFMVSNFMQNVL